MTGAAGTWMRLARLSVFRLRCHACGMLALRPVSAEVLSCAGSCDPSSGVSEVVMRRLAVCGAVCGCR